MKIAATDERLIVVAQTDTEITVEFHGKIDDDVKSVTITTSHGSKRVLNRMNGKFVGRNGNRRMVMVVV